MCSDTNIIFQGPKPYIEFQKTTENEECICTFDGKGIECATYLYDESQFGAIPTPDGNLYGVIDSRVVFDKPIAAWFELAENGSIAVSCQNLQEDGTVVQAEGDSSSDSDRRRPRDGSERQSGTGAIIGE